MDPIAVRRHTSEQAGRLTALQDLQRDLLRTRNPQEAAEAVVNRLREAAPDLRVSVILLDAVSRTAVVLASSPPGSGSLPSGARIPYRVFSPPSALYEGDSHFVDDLREQPELSLVGKGLVRDGIRAFASLPLSSGDQLIGMLNLGQGFPGSLPSDVLQLAQDCSLPLALALREAGSAERADEAEGRYQSLFEDVPVGLYRLDRDCRLEAANLAFGAILGFDLRAALGTLDFDELWVDRLAAERNRDQLRRVGVVREFEGLMRRADGREIWVQTDVRVRRDPDGSLCGYEGSLQDVSQRRQAQEQLVHEALHDALTGLPNRAFFMARLEHAVRFSQRQEDYEFAVLFLDFDRFKIVNDSLGHSLGDQLLIEGGQRLAGCLREVDTLARFGGDEFVILLDGISGIRDASHIAERIHYALAAPFSLGGHEVVATASIGIAVGSKGNDPPQDLLRDADIAMYQAKQQGPGKHVIFNAEMHRQALGLLNLESDLRRAVERNEFELAYQPIVSLADEQLRGFEALVRWRHPEKGVLLPADFLGTAEDTGLIVVLGRLVLQEACHQLREWQRDYPGWKELSVSVNLSSKQFHHPDLVDDVSRCLAENDLEPGTLHLEITEKVIVEDPARAIDTFERLKALGVHIHIDDFGTGYSSLSMLSHFPVDILKTDRTFIDRMGFDKSDLEIVRAVFSLARSLDMEVIAEGVENGGQLTTLREMGCRFAQGFFFAKPLLPAGVAQLLSRP